MLNHQEKQINKKINKIIEGNSQIKAIMETIETEMRLDFKTKNVLVCQLNHLVALSKEKVSKK